MSGGSYNYLYYKNGQDEKAIMECITESDVLSCSVEREEEISKELIRLIDLAKKSIKGIIYEFFIRLFDWNNYIFNY